METSDTTRLLEDLHQTLEDGRQGFETAADKLNEDGHADLASQMREFSQQRSRLSSELVTEAGNLGMNFDTGNGSAKGSLHRGWMSMKDALTGSDPHAILAAAERGEDHAVAKYKEVLDEDIPAGLKAFVTKQATEVKAAHDKVRELRDANAS